MTNTISAIAQAAQASPINWTIIISICAVSVAAMVAFINIFKSKKEISDDMLRESNLIQDLTSSSKDNATKQEGIKEAISTLRTEIEKIKVEMLNANKSLEDLRRDNRELVQRLDELLRQLMDLLGS